ncbi:LysR family transcriptional regulator [Amycolatopsis jejuensis]|uniref:LysR family transcriptional regulator n=1 Tax=Amycolatopsis jejuensis TaxID=330084 RepID=UPI000527370B|nr:LysR family transcriptional regulator [Amycolatopsis jejuensis]
MVSLHQFRCFLAAFECGSFTAAAAKLGYAPPTLAEHIHVLERSLHTPLFERRGRGVVPTPAAEVLRPHAERTLAAAAEATRAVGTVTSLEAGTVRFGMLAPSIIDADVIAEILDQHPGLRVELVGRSSVEVLDAVRHGQLEAALVTLPVAEDDEFTVNPIARIEHVYISSDPARLTTPITARRLAAARLVLPLTHWRAEDGYRLRLAERVQRLGAALDIRVEVEDIETAVALVRRGYADSVVPAVLLPHLAPDLGSVALKPRFFETVAVVHWKGARLSPGSKLAVELITKRIRELHGRR